jgi:hypothetical protein
MKRAPRQVLFGGTAVLLGVSLALGSAELLLRASGRRPWRYLGSGRRELTVHVPDAELGWRARPGRYDIPPYASGAPPIHMTVLPDGTRATGAGVDDAGSRLAFVGGSITQGWAISDEETFAWKIQRRFPYLRVVNHGVSGYGTYQSLQVLERVFSQPPVPQKVFYGFIEEHEMRNVAGPGWLLLVELRSTRGGVSVPYCTLDARDDLVRHAPVRYPTWPWRQHLALIAFLEQKYVTSTGRSRANQSRAVTERLLLEMDRLVKRNGARFSVALLHFTPAAKAHYVKFLEAHGVDFVDCAFPMTPAMQVRGEYHPNGKMNTRFAECLAAKIQSERAGLDRRHRHVLSTR